VSLLERIVEQKRAEVAAKAPPHSTYDPRGGVYGRVDLRNWLMRHEGAPLHLIAEVKFKSPSAGLLSRKLDASQRAAAYASGGARMVSVLCDEVFFGGGYIDLAAARKALDNHELVVPLLAKEFIVDPLQLDWVSHHGADAVLLIAKIVDAATLRVLMKRCKALGLAPFVEVATEAERDMALDAGADVLGVNARDLDTLDMDAERAARVIAGIPRDRVAVHLSGLGSADAVRAIRAGRADAALIGEALMRVDDPAPVLREFVSAALGS
jgi:indole-3-glycerol phosphate synthase